MPDKLLEEIYRILRDFEDKKIPVGQITVGKLSFSLSAVYLKIEEAVKKNLT